MTIDALGCPQVIARTIREEGADDVLALKANHEPLFEPVVAFFDRACAHRRKADGSRYHREWSERHGRDECRRCWATSEIDWLVGRESWEGLRSVVLIESEPFIGDTRAVEARSYLSSLPADAKLLNEAVRRGIRRRSVPVCGTWCGGCVVLVRRSCNFCRRGWEISQRMRRPRPEVVHRRACRGV